MASYNKIILMGNLTRDPDLKYLPSQTAVVEFGIACNDKYKNKDGVEVDDTLFMECKAFGKLAENINKFFTIGKGIHVEGKVAFDTWEDKTTGAKRTKHYVKLQNFTFTGGPKDGGGAATVGSPAPIAPDEIPF